MHKCVPVRTFSNGESFFIAFLVGTMAQVNRKICDLDQSLQDYTQLVFDSRLSEEDDGQIYAFTAGESLASAKHKRKGIDMLMLLQFLTVYANFTCKLSLFGTNCFIHCG